METVETDNIDFKAMGVPEHLIPQAKAEVEKFATELEKATLEKVSPKGTLRICELLDEKRLAWLIPDAAIEAGRGCLFNRILVWQIPMLSKVRGDRFDTHFGGGLIAKSDKDREGDQRGAPRGVIVGAGLGALDCMRSHGVDIGHTVKFLKHTVHRVQVDMIAMQWQWLSICHIHDLIHSEELAADLKSGRSEILEADGRHYYCDEDGTREPVQPVDDESM